MVGVEATAVWPDVVAALVSDQDVLQGVDGRFRYDGNARREPREGRCEYE